MIRYAFITVKQLRTLLKACALILAKLARRARNVKLKIDINLILLHLIRVIMLMRHNNNNNNDDTAFIVHFIP